MSTFLYISLLYIVLIFALPSQTYSSLIYQSPKQNVLSDDDVFQYVPVRELSPSNEVVMIEPIVDQAYFAFGKDFYLERVSSIPRVALNEGDDEVPVGIECTRLDAKTDTCYVEDNTVAISQHVTVKTEAKNIKFINYILTMSKLCNDLKPCSFVLANPKQSLCLQNSTISSPNIELNLHDLALDIDSSLSASATYGTVFQNRVGIKAGAPHAGSGGCGCYTTSCPLVSPGTSYGNAFLPRDYGSPSAEYIFMYDNVHSGGGRIMIQVVDKVFNDGIIDSNGENSTRMGIGGAAGGSIMISIAGGKGALGGTGSILAQGGHGIITEPPTSETELLTGGGSGGRIYLALGSKEPKMVISAIGGRSPKTKPTELRETNSKDNDSFTSLLICQHGAVGTIFTLEMPSTPIPSLPFTWEFVEKEGTTSLQRITRKVSSFTSKDESLDEAFDLHDQRHVFVRIPSSQISTRCNATLPCLTRAAMESAFRPTVSSFDELLDILQLRRENADEVASNFNLQAQNFQQLSLKTLENEREDEKNKHSVFTDSVRRILSLTGHTQQEPAAPSLIAEKVLLEITSLVANCATIQVPGKRIISPATWALVSTSISATPSATLKELDLDVVALEATNRSTIGGISVSIATSSKFTVDALSAIKYTNKLDISSTRLSISSSLAGIDSNAGMIKLVSRESAYIASAQAGFIFISSPTLQVNSGGLGANYREKTESCSDMALFPSCAVFAGDKTPVPLPYPANKSTVNMASVNPDDVVLVLGIMKNSPTFVLNSTFDTITGLVRNENDDNIDDINSSSGGYFWGFPLPEGDSRTPDFYDKATGKIPYMALSTSTIFLNATSLTIGNGSTVHSSSISICSKESDLKTAAFSLGGKGCPPSLGQGSPYSSPVGGGAGHAGNGGAGYAASYWSSGGPAYDMVNSPSRAGSGGSSPGGGQDGGAGGGVFYLYAQDKVSGSFTLDVNGDSSNPLIAGGGGSGGTVLFETSLLAIPSATINLNGGDGVKSAGGGGGGGSGGIFKVNWLTENAAAASRGEGPPTLLLLGGAGHKTACNESNKSVHNQLYQFKQESTSQPSSFAGRFAADLDIHVEKEDICVSETFSPFALSTEPADGAAGLASSEPTCKAGSLAPFCILCDPGKYSPTPGETYCSACEAGKSSKNSGAAICDECEGGTAAPAGSTTCTVCVPGKAAKAGSEECLECEPGTAAGEHAAECAICPENTFARKGFYKCSTCDPGMFSGKGAAECKTCPDKKKHSQYTGVGCEYVCDAGYLPPDCVTPFARFIQILGGPIAFAMLILGVLCAIAIPLAYCWIYHARAMEQKEQDDISQAQILAKSFGPGGGGDTRRRLAMATRGTVTKGGNLNGEDEDGDGIDVNFGSFGSFRNYNNTDIYDGASDQAGGQEGNGEDSNSRLLANAVGMLSDDPSNTNRRGLTSSSFATARGGITGMGIGMSKNKNVGRGVEIGVGAVNDISLQPEDLPFHFHRFYFQGRNSLFFPLWLPPTLDSGDLQNLVEHPEFARFARSVSQLSRWTTKERKIYKILSLLFAPLAVLWHASVRSAKVEHLQDFVCSYDHSFLKHPRARALGTSLRLSCSPDKTLLWLDLLSFHGEVPAHKVGMPRLPLVLVCTGYGDYSRPFAIDVTDPVVKSAAEYFGPNWYSFITSLNSYLRTASASDIFEIARVRPIMDYLNMMNHGGGIGIGNKMSLSGLQVELGVIPPIETDIALSADFSSPLQSSTGSAGSPPSPRATSPKNISKSSTHELLSIPRLAILISSLDRDDQGRVSEMDKQRERRLVTSTYKQNQKQQRLEVQRQQMQQQQQRQQQQRRDNPHFSFGGTHSEVPAYSSHTSSHTPIVFSSDVVMAVPDYVSTTQGGRGSRLGHSQSQPSNVRSLSRGGARESSTLGYVNDYQYPPSTGTTTGLDQYYDYDIDTDDTPSAGVSGGRSIMEEALGYVPVDAFSYQVQGQPDLTYGGNYTQGQSHAGQYSQSTYDVSRYGAYGYAQSSLAEPTQHSSDAQIVPLGLLSPKNSGKITLPYNFVRMEDIFSGKILPPQVVEPSFWQKLSGPYFLRPRSRSSHPMLVGFTFFILLLCYIVLIFVLSIVFVQQIPGFYVLSLLIYPLTPIALPLAGLTSIVSSSVVVAKITMLLNVLSMVNATVTLFAGIYSQFNYNVIGPIGLFLPCGLLLLNVALAPIGNIYVAHLEYQHDVASCRRDYLKDKIRADGSTQ